MREIQGQQSENIIQKNIGKGPKKTLLKRQYINKHKEKLLNITYHQGNAMMDHLTPMQMAVTKMT